MLRGLITNNLLSYFVEAQSTHINFVSDERERRHKNKYFYLQNVLKNKCVSLEIQFFLNNPITFNRHNINRYGLNQCYLRTRSGVTVECRARQ